MRFLDYLLLERNIVNTEEIDRFLKSTENHTLHNISDIHRKAIRKWVASNLKNYLLRDYPNILWIPNDLLHRNPNKHPWVKKAAGRGDKLYNIEITRTFKNQIDHVLDYFQSNPDLNISRISAQEAIRQSEEWTKQLNKKASSEDDLTGIKEVRKYPDGFKWDMVFSDKALEREGKLMSHCVGSYCNLVKSGASKIYSLRDKKNEPHCTVEVVNADIIQMQGKGNSKVDKKYIKYCRDFVKKPVINTNWNEIGDLDNIGLIELDGNYLELDKLTASDKEEFIDKIMEYLYSRPVREEDYRTLGWANDIMEISNVRNSDIGIRAHKEQTGYKYEIVNLLFGKYEDRVADAIKKGLRTVTLKTILEYYKIVKRDFGY